MTEYNTKTFGNVPIGVHGKELPKFQDDPSIREYWKLNNSYTEDPAIQSRKKLIQKNKFWAKPDEISLADTKTEPPPSDPFKLTHLRKNKKEEKMIKINEINAFKGESIESIPRAHITRWSDSYQKFNIIKSNPRQEDKTEELIKNEEEPLYSSFAADKVFIDPLIKMKSKER